MSLHIPDGAERAILSTLRDAWQNSVRLRLYVNSHVVSDSDTAASFTEPTFAGYGPIILDHWDGPFTDATGRGRIEERLRVFTCLGPPFTERVYGYFVTDGSGALLWAEAAENPKDMDMLGKEFSVFPRFTLRSEF